jgi:hypothetical protein
MERSKQPGKVDLLLLQQVHRVAVPIAQHELDRPFQTILQIGPPFGKKGVLVVKNGRRDGETDFFRRIGRLR